MPAMADKLPEVAATVAVAAIGIGSPLGFVLINVLAALRLIEYDILKPESFLGVDLTSYLAYSPRLAVLVTCSVLGGFLYMISGGLLI